MRMMKLTNRLQTCADLVRLGCVLADIGCDHGYVPVSLYEQGKISGAIAADINEGPLSACRALVKKRGYDDKIKCVLSDGLKNIPGNEVDDILIAGMGGELIAEILSNCGYVCVKHLILNPMTHPEAARRWLFENGFAIQNDIIVSDGRHHYNVFDAVYTGEYRNVTERECFLGNITDFSDKEYFRHLLNYLKSKEKSGVDYSEVIHAIEEKINDNG